MTERTTNMATAWDTAKGLAEKHASAGGIFVPRGTTSGTLTSIDPAHRDVVQHGQVEEWADQLERARDTAATDPVWAEPGNVGSLEAHPPGLLGPDKPACLQDL